MTFLNGETFDASSSQAFLRGQAPAKDQLWTVGVLSPNFDLYWTTKHATGQLTSSGLGLGAPCKGAWWCWSDTAQGYQNAMKRRGYVFGIVSIWRADPSRAATCRVEVKTGLGSEFPCSVDASQRGEAIIGRTGYSLGGKKKPEDTYTGPAVDSYVFCPRAVQNCGLCPAEILILKGPEALD